MYYIEGIHGVVNFFRRQIGRDKPLWSIQYRGRPYYMDYGGRLCLYCKIKNWFNKSNKPFEHIPITRAIVLTASRLLKQWVILSNW